ncbi:MAG: hypothetical protein ACFFDT_22910 [Candidatus Hodarchaeota archaeon]
MAVQEINYSQKDELIPFVPCEMLPANVLRTDISTIIMDADIPMASQNDTHIINGNLEMIQEGRTVFINQKLKSDIFSESVALPVKIHYPANSYTIVIDGKLSQTLQGKLRVIKGTYELVTKNNIFYFNQNPEIC